MNAISSSAGWQQINAQVLKGHRVASGQSENARFPGGTLLMQTPYFRALGLNLDKFHRGTLNVGIAPLSYRVVRPRITYHNVKWHPIVPAENFSFFDARLLRAGEPPVEGLIYYPHPETKLEHFQRPDVLELLLPFVEGIAVGSELRLEIPLEQMIIETV